MPGITSMQAAAAAAGVPLAMLAGSVAIVPATYGIEHLPGLVRDFPLVCLLKVHTVFDQLLDHLALLTQPIDAVYVEKVGTARSSVIVQCRDLPLLLAARRFPIFRAGAPKAPLMSGRRP